MFQEPNDRLAGAVKELLRAGIKQEPLDRAEGAVLSRFEPKLPFRFRGLVWTTAATAAVLAGAFLLLPSRSAAADFGRILKNGDIGMRHVTAYRIESDGSRKLELEFYADGDKARMEMPGEKVFWEGGLLTVAHDGGASEIQRYRTSVQVWFDYSAKQIIALNSDGKSQKVTVTHDAPFGDRHVDRYVLDVDLLANRYETIHRHCVLYADPVTERPLQVETEMTGTPRELVTWEYPASDPGGWKLPPIDRSRLYDDDSERNLLSEAPRGHGPSVVVAGHRVELIQLWIDDRGNAAAVTQADYEHPDNFSVRINGTKLGTAKEDEASTPHFLVHKPMEMDGRPIDVFYGYNSKSAPKPIPINATVSIPVVANGRIVGFAEFGNVKVQRTWNVMQRLQTFDSPFAPHEAGATAAHSGSRGQP